MLTENLQIYKDTKELCRVLLTYQPNIAKIIRYHHLIMNKLNHLFESEMIEDTYACRKNKGTLYGIKRVQQHMREVGKNGWYAKCDIQGFFMSIDRKKLYHEIETIILLNKVDSWEWWLWLLELVILHNPDKNCILKGDASLWNKLPKNKSLFYTDEKGLPIGNLTSQIFANIYMSEFDKWITKKLGKEGRYGRYVDDFIIIHPDKKKVLELVKESEKWLDENLGIKLHPKKLTIQQIFKGVRFTGIFIKNNCLYPSKRLVENTYFYIKNWNGKNKKKFRDKINSRIGLMVHFNSYNLRRRFWREIRDYDGIIFVNNKKIKIYG